VLQAITKVWHTDPVTGVVTLSDIIAGEDGVAWFEPSECPYGSVKPTIGQNPLRSVRVEASVSWPQAIAATVDLGEFVVTSYSGDGVINDVPAPGAGLSGGWSCLNSTVTDVNKVAGAKTASWSTHSVNNEKVHNNGDVLSVTESQTRPVLSGPALS